MRPDANRIAFDAGKAILAAAQPLDLDVDGKRVRCGVTKLEVPEWPDTELPGLDPARDRPWPAPADIECSWEGGKALLRLAIEHWDRKPYRGLIGVRVLVRPGNRSLVWSTLATAIGDAEDGTTLSVPGWCAIVKRKKYAIEELHVALKQVVKGAGLAMLSNAQVQLFQLELPSGTVLPSAAVAFRHLVQLALLKLDFLDRGGRAAERGKPLIDIRRFLPEGFKDAAETEVTDEDDDDDNEPTSTPRERIPLNLILYGPPGTGKTYQLLTEFSAQFTREHAKKAAAMGAEQAEAIAELPWWQVVALALND